jgi:hypothetical protein
MKIVPILGRTFGRLTILTMEGEVRHKNSCWLCQCSCGKQKYINGKNLHSEHTRSCGCLQNEVRWNNHLRKPQ